MGTIYLDSVMVADENLLLSDVEVDLAQLSGTYNGFIYITRTLQICTLFEIAVLIIKAILRALFLVRF